MPISRSQMERQLRMGGGIMSLEPRQQFLFGGIGKSIKKAVKGVSKGIKSLAKSDLGKAALTAAALYYGGGGNLFGAQRAGMSGFSLGNLPGASLFNAANATKTGTSLFNSTGAKVALGGTLLGGMFAKAEQGDEEAIAATRNVDALRSYLDKGYRNLGYKEDEIPSLVESDVVEYTSGQGGYAMGGRVNYKSGTPKNVILPKAKPRESRGKRILDLLANNKKGAINTLGAKGLFDLVGQSAVQAYRKGEISKSQYDSMIKPFFGEPSERLSKRVFEETKELRANGGRINRAYGSDDLVEQASGIAGLDININPKGVKELDLRETGGFIPPVGVKEKADDIPAMLSNNEFVFTADAVRAAGGGSVNKGAQIMYDTMKKLENGGRV